MNGPVTWRAADIDDFAHAIGASGMPAVDLPVPRVFAVLSKLQTEFGTEYATMFSHALDAAQRNDHTGYRRRLDAAAEMICGPGESGSDMRQTVAGHVAEVDRAILDDLHAGTHRDTAAPGLAGHRVAVPSATGPAREPGCLYCQPHDLSLNRVAGGWGTVYARWDNYPASAGHLEIVPFRHVQSFFDLTDQEASDLHRLARAMRHHLDRRLRPDGYTLGVNDGAAAGRSIDHLHLHLIPRWHGDVPDPRGGIRRIFPDCDPDAWQQPAAGKELR